MALYEDAIACNEAATNFARLFTEAVPPPVEAGLEPLLKWLGTALPACSRAPRSEVVRVIEHLADHIAEPLSLTRAAEIAHMHPQYLSNLFKYETGVGYADFVCLMRIEHAQRLLSETDMNLREISEASGFSDVAYFCRKFKQKTALTAGQWRKRAK
jgi:AraC-like DNA-binding protein